METPIEIPLRQLDPRIKVLDNISPLINSVFDPDHLLQLILESATKVMEARASSILLLDEKTNKLFFHVATGDKREDIKKFAVPLGQGIAGQVAKTGTSILVPDVTKDPRWDKKISESVGFETKSIACVPLKIQDKVIGVVEIIDREDGTSIKKEDMEILDAFSNLASSAIEKAQAYKKISQENLTLKIELEHRYQIVGESTTFGKLVQDATKVANSKSTILITGESGTGKELIARLIHRVGARRDNPFVVVNCGAVPETLLEAELFGHEKGAFTGASYRKIGLFEAAHTGTIFLDEVGEMSPPMQVKLLRVLQEGAFNRIGNSTLINVDVRVISATNKNIFEEVTKRNFREDLYYRLNVIQLAIPPLRERKEDIPALVDFFIKRFKTEMGFRDLEMSEDALHLISTYHWPGNVRELENAIERAVVMGGGHIILPKDLPINSQQGIQQDSTAVGMTLKAALDIFKKDFITKTLLTTDGNRKKAAKILDVQRTYLSRLIKEHNIKA
jgi:Nif-specific regulatory protein